MSLNANTLSQYTNSAEGDVDGFVNDEALWD